MWTSISVIILLTWAVNPGPAKLLPSPYLLRNRNVERDPIPVEGDVGSTLILTPYIEDGKIEEARSLSAVSGGPIPEDIPSHSGFFTVNKQYNSNLFFWFFPAEVSRYPRYIL
jgi:vitellogenic carboxypeptidase-like protein